MQEFWNVLAKIKIDSNYRQTSVCGILEKLHFTFKTVPKRFFVNFQQPFFWLPDWLNFLFSCSVTQGLFMFKHFFCHPRSFLVLKSICLSSTKWKKDDYSHPRFHMRKKTMIFNWDLWRLIWRLFVLNILTLYGDTPHLLIRNTLYLV